MSHKWHLGVCRTPGERGGGAGEHHGEGAMADPQASHTEFSLQSSSHSLVIQRPQVDGWRMGKNTEKTRPLLPRWGEATPWSCVRQLPLNLTSTIYLLGPQFCSM